MLRNEIPLIGRSLHTWRDGRGGQTVRAGKTEFLRTHSFGVSDIINRISRTYEVQRADHNKTKVSGARNLSRKGEIWKTPPFATQALP